MSQIEKGVILTIEGEPDRNDNYTKARVQSNTAVGTETLPLTIPWYLRGSMGNLEKGTEVVYAMFEDASGVILSRMDGNWEGKIEETQLTIDLMDTTAQVAGSIQISDKAKAGSVEADSVKDGSIRLASHRHSGVEQGSGNTGTPNGGN